MFINTGVKKMKVTRIWQELIGDKTSVGKKSLVLYYDERIDFEHVFIVHHEVKTPTKHTDVWNFDNLKDALTRYNSL
jgi:hypothetical protein